ncbi:MAG: tetratricopeptide repeat protein [Polyangiaceae bacterium]|nr:tetratricopeptide repeat protein [Polyangiaceae bacterium]
MAPLLLLALDLAAIALFVWLGVRIYQTIGPALWAARGRHDRARRLYDRMAHKGLFASTRRVGSYGVAICDLQLGRFEEALRALTALDREGPPPELQLGVDVAIGTALLQLDRDMEEARDRFERASHRLRQPDVLLGLAHAELAIGNEERALELADEAAQMPATATTTFGRHALLRRSGRMVEHSTDFLLGWFLTKVGRDEEAAPLLEEVSRWPVRSWLTDKAQTLLAAMDLPPAEVTEEPPSTAAVVIDR